MTIITQTTDPVTMYHAHENGWDLKIITSQRGTSCHMGRSQYANLVRFYCSLTITPAEKRLTVVMFDDCPINRIVHLIRLAHTLARRNGVWTGTDWGRGLQRNGNEWLSIKLGAPVDVAHEFASLTERIDMTSEVSS